MTTGALWDNITTSPAVLAARRALDDLPSHADFPDPMAGRLYVAGPTAPIRNIRRQMNVMNMPSGMFLGEIFERRVFDELYTYHRRRNYLQSLDQFARDAQFEYHLTYKSNATREEDDPARDVNDRRWRGLELCITPSPIVLFETDTLDWIAFVRAWIDWLIPWFVGSIEIILCDFARIPLLVTLGAAVTIYKRATVGVAA